MKKDAVKGRKQGAIETSVAMEQLMLPLLLAMDATKKGLLAFVQQMGMTVLQELLATEAALIAGPKGKHLSGRTHHHCGTGRASVAFGVETSWSSTRGFVSVARVGARWPCRAWRPCAKAIHFLPESLSR